jgi:putative transposase
MILTYKIKHNKNFSDELRKAKHIADFAVMNPLMLSSKYVKHIGLKSIIANQILRKYGRNKNIKQVKNVKLVIPGQSISLNKENKAINIVCLQLSFNYQFHNDFTKINQIEIGEEYIYVSVTIPEKEQIKTEKFIGVDLNVTGHVAIVAHPETGKILKLGKKVNHIHKKY